MAGGDASQGSAAGDVVGHFDCRLGHVVVGDYPAVGIAEHDLAAGLPLAAEAAFVQQPVMVPAELQQIVETGLAAVSPVIDVVAVQVVAVDAPREAAAFVAGAQRTPYRRRNRHC